MGDQAVFKIIFIFHTLHVFFFLQYSLLLNIHIFNPFIHDASFLYPLRKGALGKNGLMLSVTPDKDLKTLPLWTI